MASAKGRRCRFPLIKLVLALLNLGSTVLTIFSGLAENPLLVLLTGKYDPLRARLQDGSINLEIASTETLRLDYITPLKEIGTDFRFITAPRRTPYSTGTNRTLCPVVNSINASTISVCYDDFFGPQGARRFQIPVFSISAPGCKVLNLKPKWRDDCIKTRGNATACYQYIMDNFEALQENRVARVGVVSDWGTQGAAFLKCLGRPFKTFDYQTDMVTHQAFWAGASWHAQIQTSDCQAKPLSQTTDLKWTLFQAMAVNDACDIVMALPQPGWFSTIVSGLYSIVSIVLIVRGVVAFLLQNRSAGYISNEVRYSKDRRLARYCMPFMSFAMLLTEEERSIVVFKGSLLIASDVWMNHWLYITLSILDSVTNVRLSYYTYQLGTGYVIYRVNFQNFLFVCTALTRMSWILCLLHTILRQVFKVAIRSLKSMQVIRATTRDKIERYIDGSTIFLSFKVYNILLFTFFLVMLLVKKNTTFMIRGNPYKPGSYGGIPKIAGFWKSELMCDFVSIFSVLLLCGQTLGTLLMLTRFRLVADNNVMRLLQQRYFWVGWDGLMAAQMLGLDPMHDDLLIEGHAYTKASLGTILQLMYQSGPSAFVHLAGDYIFTSGGFTAEPRTIHFPVRQAVAMGLCISVKGSQRNSTGAEGEASTIASTNRISLHSRRQAGPGAAYRIDETATEDSASTEPLRGTFTKAENTSIFDRRLKLVASGYLGQLVLVDMADPGSVSVNKETGLREYVLTDALAKISILDIRYLLKNDKKLRLQ
ncbi:hypothetical protein Poli38472_009271 [Pythium oligandrum]|uniref:Uncharacterized protein n=1 Tax=Pythium oligandrum TaxID=41045 RepID=A0A8K1CL72_PYTOL|nr:hypothetical protein Poli38472_009271 [Pythium oligandrum]|eukprot:TMW65104.1 hypothetical protein Poli38472_009271 [Pythium oligandrum]